MFRQFPPRLRRAAKLRLDRLEDRTVPASFQGLGFLAGGNSSRALGVSADGSTVVGDTWPSTQQAFQWTASSGIVGLGTLPGDTNSFANAVSADGFVIVGASTNVPGQYSRAFRWTAAGMDNLGSGYAYGVSPDGSVVVGLTGSSPFTSTEAFRWTSAAGMAILGSGYAYGASTDGSVVVGYSGGQAFRWTAAGGMLNLGYLPGASQGSQSHAYAVSADGSVVVGESGQAFRWTAADGMVGLGFLPGGYDSYGFGVSADGSVIVGRDVATSGEYRAFLWTAAEGMRDLRDVLVADYGLANQLNGWTLGEALGCSADGKVIVGDGTDPAGQTEAWIARLETPPITPPQVQTIQINDGSIQRSRVTSLRVTFDKVVTLPVLAASAFQLVRQSDGAAPTLSAAVNTGVTTSVTLTFSGSAVNSGSLADGRYTLTVFAAQVSNIDGVANLDGNGDGIAGDDYVLACAPSPDPPTNIFRLFGDSDGNGRVDATDFLAFRLAYISINSTFDFDGDTLVGPADLLQFRLRFLQGI